MGISESKAIDIMKKATGKKIIDTSFNKVPNGFIALVENEQQLVCITDGACAFADKLECTLDEYKYGVRLRLANTNNKNSQALRFFLKWTAPGACTNQNSSIGFEDAFALTLPKFAQDLQNSSIKPVICANTNSAQILSEQMGNTAWQALEIGLKSGYGAEFSYAKTEQEIVNALLCGYTSFVVDCSDKIDKTNFNLTSDEIMQKAQNLPEEFRQALIESYVDKNFSLDNGNITYTKEEVFQIALCYGQAIAHLQYLYNGYFKNAPWQIDFCIFLGDNDLDAKAHYLIANELSRVNVKLAAIELSPQNPSFVQNTYVAKVLLHKVRLVIKDLEVLKTVENNANCAFDLRIEKGSELLNALKVLEQNNPDFIKELPDGFSNLTNNEKIKLLQQKQPQIKTLLKDHLNVYYDLIKKSIDIQKDFLKKA